jgi:hypothetical protein
MSMRIARLGSGDHAWVYVGQRQWVGHVV